MTLTGIFCNYRAFKVQFLEAFMWSYQSVTDLGWSSFGSG